MSQRKFIAIKPIGVAAATLLIGAILVFIYPPLWSALFAREFSDPALLKPKRGINFIVEDLGDYSANSFRSSFRGGAVRNGVSESGRIPLDLEVKWRREPLNVGNHSAAKASPAVDETGVYVGADTGQFLGVNHDGHVKWTFHVAFATRGIHGTAALDASRVYFGAYNGMVYAVRKSDGHLAWFDDTTGVALGASILPAGDSLIVNVETDPSPPYEYSDDGMLLKIRARDGAIDWVSDWIGQQSHSSPALAEGRVFLGTNQGVALALDLNTGKELWRTTLGGKIRYPAVVADGVVYITGTSKRLYALDPRNGAIQWSIELGTSLASAPARVPDSDIAVVIDWSATWYGIDVKTHQVKWRLKVSEEPRQSHALIARDPRGRWRAWVACFDQELCALEPDSGRILSRIKVGGWVSGEPVAWKDSIYLALNDQGGLVKLGPRKKNLKGR